MVKKFSKEKAPTATVSGNEVSAKDKENASKLSEVSKNIKGMASQTGDATEELVQRN